MGDFNNTASKEAIYFLDSQLMYKRTELALKNLQSLSAMAKVAELKASLAVKSASRRHVILVSLLILLTTVTEAKWLDSRNTQTTLAPVHNKQPTTLAPATVEGT